VLIDQLWLVGVAAVLVDVAGVVAALAVVAVAAVAVVAAALRSIPLWALLCLRIAIKMQRCRCFTLCSRLASWLI